MTWLNPTLIALLMPLVVRLGTLQLRARRGRQAGHIANALLGLGLGSTLWTLRNLGVLRRKMSVRGALELSGLHLLTPVMNGVNCVLTLAVVRWSVGMMLGAALALQQWDAIRNLLMGSLFANLTLLVLIRQGSSVITKFTGG